MTVNLKPLAEQVIVITGASSGIGLVTARRAAAGGAKVLLVARSADALGDAVRQINNTGGTADFAVADVGDAAQVKRAAETAIERFGRIDTWINDAGVAIYAKLVDTPEDEHRKLFETNYWGVVHGSLTAVAHLRAKGGALITVGSIGSDMATPLMSAYAASKHAVKGFTESLRIELEGDGVPVSITLVKPSGIDTPIAQHAANHTGAGEAQIPPLIYAPELVADAILHAAVHPQREITVGGSGRAQVLFSQHFKALYEKLAPASTKAMTDPQTPQPPTNLWEAEVNAGRERSGEHTAKEWSLYTAAAMHPRLTSAVIGGTLAGAVALLFARGGKKTD
ncbi:SDR family oxidoreductase [Sphingomonas bacterium]|uniref:SDR family oxidoreductase n=1 Tax=Sphingomonas bacterium TaxID=1895847 RepID=UPI00157777C6|nr:SDR family oxidoreductase [Sphingomonas bacterium]